MDFLDVVEIIENRRLLLKNDSRVIEVIDYGAGKSHDKRTKKEMEDGIIQNIPICEFAGIGVKKEKAFQIYEIFNQLKPKIILELGTCCGFSSAYMSYFAGDARIYTVEGSPSLANIASENHKLFSLDNIEILEGRFDLILPNLLEKISPIDFTFIDGHHDRDATLNYFKQILPYMNKGGVMLFDDISWNDSMKEAWNIIVDSGVYERYTDYSWMGAIWL